MTSGNLGFPKPVPKRFCGLVMAFCGLIAINRFARASRSSTGVISQVPQVKFECFNCTSGYSFIDNCISK